jgi:hypothetical protein
MLAAMRRFVANEPLHLPPTAGLAFELDAGERLARGVDHTEALR